MPNTKLQSSNGTNEQSCQQIANCTWQTKLPRDVNQTEMPKQNQIALFKMSTKLSNCQKAVNKYQSNAENLGQVQDAEERNNASNISNSSFSSHTFSEQVQI